MDQGGELWRSNQLREVSTAVGYAMEPTCSDVASENGKVERPNGTFSAKVRCLLYSTGLGAFFWSAALVYMVYLNNRLYHKALCQTLGYEQQTVLPAITIYSVTTFTVSTALLPEDNVTVFMQTSSSSN
jgi:hypothetical protein